MTGAAVRANAGARDKRSQKARLGIEAVAIVVAVALLETLRSSLKFLFTDPVPTLDLLYGASDVFRQSALTGFIILLAVVAARNRVPGHGVRPYAVVFAAIVVSAALGTAIAILQNDDYYLVSPGEIVLYLLIPDWIRYSLLGALISGAWIYVCAEAEQAAEAEQIAIDSARTAEQVTEARLRMLEAQIEPHFLFNVLANVQRLYETDRATGERMLVSLKTYLGVALPQMREERSTLMREIAHAKAYLDIQGIRMGRRLAYAIDVPSELAQASVPPLMVLTLVENAVKHGLAPARSGGRIDVRASRNDTRLDIVVADTGQGFTTTQGAGTGLANARTRLRVRYGDAAGLQLSTNAPRGVVATLTLPYAELPAVAA